MARRWCHEPRREGAHQVMTSCPCSKHVVSRTCVTVTPPEVPSCVDSSLYTKHNLTSHQLPFFVRQSRHVPSRVCNMAIQPSTDDAENSPLLNEFTSPADIDNDGLKHARKGMNIAFALK